MSEEPAELVKDALESARESRFNSIVAALVAMVAVMMALCHIKDGRIVLAMSQAQAHGVDAWSYYQSKGTKQHLAESTADQLTIQLLAAPPAARAALEADIARYRAEAKLEAAQKDSVARAARGYAETYEQLDLHVDQFDVAEASFSIAVALSGIAALTRRRWLLVMGVVVVVFGAWFGLCGFLGLSFHPSWLSGWLG